LRTGTCTTTTWPIINADSLAVSYVTGLMNINLSLAVNETNGKVTVVGTDALNWVRFEPNINGVFARVNIAAFDPDSPNLGFHR
jgi:hypothetical protein